MLDRLLIRAQGFLPRIFTVLALFFVGLLALGPQITFNDIGWHLAQGMWKFEHLRFLRQDWFNYPTLGRPLIDEYPLYQAMLTTAWKLGGEYGLNVLALLVFTGIFWMLLAWPPFKANASPPLGYAAGLTLAMFLAMPRLLLRPEIATFAGCAFTMLFLLRNRGRRDWKSFWPLYLAQCAWTNCHSGFILGWGLVAAFGIETTLRDAISHRRIDWSLARHWAAISSATFLACLINPAGWHRLALPFFHQGDFTIRAYVTEMQPWQWEAGDPFFLGMLVAILLTALVAWRKRGVCWSFLAITAAMGWMSFHSQRQLAVFAFLLPGTLASAYVLGRREGAPRALSTRGWRLLQVLGWTLLLALTIPLALSPLREDFVGSLPAKWDALRFHQVEYPLGATRWLREHQLSGRLLHRSEIGGWLQLNGFSGKTWADTGFGKYTPAFIHEVGLACERPGYLPVLIKRYNPEIIVVSVAAYQWPRVLRAGGWRPVFYAADGSVWVPEHAPAFAHVPTVSQQEVAHSFQQTLARAGIPQKYNVYARWLLALQSFGLEPEALRLALSAPSEFQASGLFWNMAERMLEARIPAANEPLWCELDELAKKTPSKEPSRFYQARRLAGQKKILEAITTLEPLPRSLANSRPLAFLGSLYIKAGRWDQALSLLQAPHLFDLNEADRYELLALCHRHAGNSAAQAEAARLAHYFAPDLY